MVVKTLWCGGEDSAAESFAAVCLSFYVSVSVCVSVTDGVGVEPLCTGRALGVVKVVMKSRWCGAALLMYWCSTHGD